MVSDFLKDCSPLSEAQPALQKLRRLFSSVCRVWPRHLLILLFARISFHSFAVCLVRKPRHTGLSCNSVSHRAHPRAADTSNTLYITFNGTASSCLTSTRPLSHHWLLTVVWYCLWISFQPYFSGTAPRMTPCRSALARAHLRPPNARPHSREGPAPAAFQQSGKTPPVSREVKPRPR